MAGILTPVVPTSAPIAPSVAVMQNNIDMNGNRVIGLPAPSAMDEAARLQDTHGITIPVLNSIGVPVSVALSK